ncbi:TPA: ATP-dependent DNA helicase DinG [Vibrio parahaemolyticus]
MIEKVPAAKPLVLTDKIKDEIRGLYKSVQNELSGFKPRKEQSYLIAEIAKTLGGVYTQNEGATRRIIAAEAGTGTGKTFAYLIPSIVLAKALNKKLIVSTANVSLQSQLELKDLPLLQKIRPDMTFKVALGRNRYLCRRDIEAVAVGAPPARSEDTLFDDQEPLEKVSGADAELLERMIENYDMKAWDGVIDNWPVKGEVIASTLWNKVNCKSGTCTKRICPYFEECAFHNARKTLDTTDVIIANHALTMTSLANGGNVLPAADEAIWVIDEAHHIPKQYRSSFEQKVTIENSLAWLKKVSQAVSKLSMVHGQEISQSIVKDGKELDEVVKGCVEELRSVTDMLLANCNFSSDYSQEQIYRFKDGLLPSVLDTSLSNLSTMSGKINRCVSAHTSKLQECLEKRKIPSSSAIEKILSESNRLQAQTESFNAMWELFTKNEHKGAVIAKWVTCGGNGKPDLSFNAVPISVGQELEDTLWSKAAGAVLTSATVTSLGNFDRFMLEAGLHANDGTQYCRVKSPFDYQNQARLIIPPMKFEPTAKNEEQHTSEIVHYTEQMAQKHNAMLMLFTSYRQLNRYIELVPPELRTDMLIQGQDSRPMLIRRHKERVDNGKRSILVGVASLGEGMDLPAHYLTGVGIAKLPFANFKEPVDEAESEFISNRGGNPFYELSLPETSAKLIQQVGRLIRSAQCQGEVLIFDRRLSTKKYGAQLIDSLPPFKLFA